MASSLDMLCDMLDEEISDEEAVDNPEATEPEKEKPKSTLPPEQEVDPPSSPRLEILVPEETAAPASSEEENEDETESMEAQLKAMQEQMAAMQKALLEKKSKKKIASRVTSPVTRKTVEKVVASSSSSSSAVVKTPSQEVVPLRKKSLADLDMFSVDQSSSSSASGSSRMPAETLKKMRSPVKTNPFAESDRPRKLAKTYHVTPKYGPALSKKTTRTITGDEKDKILSRLEPSEKDRLLAMVKNDLGDSSDEEAERNPMEQKYNDFGREVKRITRVNSSQASHNPGFYKDTSASSSKPTGFDKVQGSTLNLSNSAANKPLPQNLMLEKYSKLRVSRPIIESRLLDIHMLNKKFIPIFKMNEAIARKENEGDWVTIGVLFYKSSQTSKNGNSYTIWKLTDLQGDIKNVSVLLFGRAHAVHYKMPMNKVVGILNPKVLEDRGGKREVSLSVDHPDKVMEIGDSLDAGKCAFKKPDGSGCQNLVNLAGCEYCNFHVKKAYKAISSKRGDLQSSFSGNGDVRARLMGKVDPKGDYFAGGQTVNAFQPQVGKVGVKQRSKDASALAKLGVVTVPRVEKMLQNNPKMKFKPDMPMLERKAVKSIAKNVSSDLAEKLLTPTPGTIVLMKHLTNDAKDENSRKKSGQDAQTPSQSEKSATQLLFEHKQKLALERRQKVLIEKQNSSVPLLGKGFGAGDMINLNSSKLSSSVSALDRAKARAKALLDSKGKSLEKSDPHLERMARKRKSGESEKKRTENVSKALMGDDKKFMEKKKSEEKKMEKEKTKIASTGDVMTKERMDKIRNKKSKFQNLIEAHEEDQVDKVLDTLEKKESMEEKMINTMEIEVKAVTCKRCSYTCYKQTDMCKESGHSVKYITVMKKFFECKGCKRRTTALDKYPKTTCTNCGGSAWIRCGMMREKKGPVLDSEKLVIRGAEQKFLGAAVKSTDLNLGLD